MIKTAGDGIILISSNSYFPEYDKNIEIFGIDLDARKVEINTNKLREFITKHADIGNMIFNILMYSIAIYACILVILEIA